jgi:hypothetical protein
VWVFAIASEDLSVERLSIRRLAGAIGADGGAFVFSFYAFLVVLLIAPFVDLIRTRRMRGPRLAELTGAFALLVCVALCTSTRAQDLGVLARLGVMATPSDLSGMQVLAVVVWLASWLSAVAIAVGTAGRYVVWEMAGAPQSGDGADRWRMPMQGGLIFLAGSIAIAFAVHASSWSRFLAAPSKHEWESQRVLLDGHGLANSSLLVGGAAALIGLGATGVWWAISERWRDS